MDIWLNKEEADLFNQINEIIYGDSTHRRHKYIAGARIELMEILRFILDALMVKSFLKKKKRGNG